MQPDARRLIINADDFGLTAGVNAGIADVHRAGALTAASVLVNTPGFSDAVSLARTMPSLDLGLHFNLTLGAPISPPDQIPTLVNPSQGTFCTLAQLAWRAWTGRLRADDVARELHAQWQVATRAGLALTHVDGHQHAHFLPGVAPVVQHVAASLGVRHVRIPREPYGVHPFRLRATAVKAALHLAQHRAHTPAAPVVAHWRGLSLEGHPHFGRALLHDIANLPVGVTELMVHPGYVDDELAALDPYLAPRAREVEALVSEPVRTALQSSAIRLTTFRAL